MREFSVQKRAHLTSSWKTSSFFPFGGIKHDLLFIILSFMIGVKTHCYAWVLANIFILFQTLMKLLTIIFGTSCAGGIGRWF